MYKTLEAVTNNDGKISVLLSRHEGEIPAPFPNSIHYPETLSSVYALEDLRCNLLDEANRQVIALVDRIEQLKELSLEDIREVQS